MSPLSLALAASLAACGSEAPEDAGSPLPMMMPPPGGDGGMMMPPPGGDGGMMMPPPGGDGGMMMPPGGDGGTMTPRMCTTAADCAGACPMAAAGCACASTPMGMACVPSCARDADCPMTPMGQLTCNTMMRVCVPR